MGASPWLSGLAPVGSGIRACSIHVWLEGDAGTREHWGMEWGQQSLIPALGVVICCCVTGCTEAPWPETLLTSVSEAVCSWKFLGPAFIK